MIKVGSRLKLFIRLCLAMSLVGIVAGCTNNKITKPNVITLSAAASLTDCIVEIQKEFEDQYPDIQMQINFGSSGALARQIEQGAPVDIFFSAGMKQMDELKNTKHITEDNIKNILKNRLVLITPKDKDMTTNFEGLSNEAIKKIAIGEPESVPVGQYTMEVLENLNLKETLNPKFVYAKDVREVLSWVETGNADAGVVYETDAKTSQGVKVDKIAKENWHEPIIYPVASIPASKYLREAEMFIEFIQQEKSKAIFEKHGFSPVF